MRAVSEMTALALLREGTGVLAVAGLGTARQDAEWLLASVLGIERPGLYLDPAREVAPVEGARYRDLIARRVAHEPLQYLLGWEDFHGLRIVVSQDVLVPRPETEGLVEWALQVLRGLPSPVAADIGTGSGAIACALARSLPDLEVLAVEQSPGALAVASQNVRRLGLTGQVRLLAGDLFGPLGSLSAALDVVVANPPYLPSALISSLPREVSHFEPRPALDGGPDGMAVLRRLIAGAPAVLKPGGRLLMEIGEEQAGPLASLMAAEGFSGIEARRDLNGVERFVGGRWDPGASEPRGGLTATLRRGMGS